MTSYGGPSLGPDSPAHGSQRVYLGQMVKGLMVQPWPLGQPENIWHGMLRWSTYAPHHTSRHRRVCWPRVGPDGESQGSEVRRFAYHACFPASGYRDSRPTCDPSACDFINQIGSPMSAITGDRRETAFLFQRQSMVIQRFNLVAFLGTFPSAIEDEAIMFYNNNNNLSREHNYLE